MLARGVSIGNVDDEIRRAQLAGLGLLELDAVIAPLRPAWTLAVPDGLDAAAVSEADLGVLRLGGLPFGSLVPRAPSLTPAAMHGPSGRRAARRGGRSSPTIRIWASVASGPAMSPISARPGWT